MFTGIVTGTAPILRIDEGEGIRKITVDLGDFLDGLETGASVSLDGVCMTVVSIDSGLVTFDAISETLDRTTLSDRSEGDLLNVERSMRLGDELGGHILSGHVMGTAEIIESRTVGEGLDLLISIPDGCSPFILEKGFIAVDGMSLTVGKCDEGSFGLHIIPETLRITTLDKKVVGDRVNIEIDSRTQAVVETMLRMGKS
ncbi:MAG: riboflavin synthase subunit alpha [Candidatus Thalassarchaeaceae archaeon]|nr:riboflavin synthase subunit alpha [Candidatus Thalassarchaeaceae archaeon]